MAGVTNGHNRRTTVVNQTQGMSSNFEVTHHIMIYIYIAPAPSHAGHACW